MKRTLHRTLLPLVTALLLAGCATPSAVAPTAPPPPLSAFKESGDRWANVAPADTQPRGTWWRTFNDPVLDDLVARAEAGNTSLQVAAAHVAQARALLRDAQAQLLPTLGAGASVTRGTPQPGLGALPGAVVNVGSAGFTAAWEPDVFGKLSGVRDAAALDARSRMALQQDARLLVDAEVAQAYFGLRSLDAERAIVRQTVEAYRDTLKLTERRFQAGDVAELDLARVRAEVASTTSQALALDRQRALHEHALAVLLGEGPSNFALADKSWDGDALPVVPPGVPSTLLTRRPDVAAAQLAMQAAEARAGVARKAWFPDIALTGNAGYASTDLGHLFDWSARAWGVGALLSLPLFDGGRRAAGVQVADAQWDEAAANYREQVLVAFRDVEDELASLRLLADQADAQATAVDAATRATALSDARYRNGLVSQLDLLDARRSELADRRVAVQVRAQRYEATVGLIRALGGAWGDAPAASAASTSMSSSSATVQKS
ncbi:MAG TPA: efflux transporter outer membrane subunit [Burkholderiaceae bacterium]|jgi:multidrug efflux system outer membrane protein|nr:efflux transporter outer membrane subunit [Burkholderiaceae bacterium]